MVLPKQAQDQVNRANEILEQLSKPPEEPELKLVEEPPVEEPPEEPPVEEPPVEEPPLAAEVVAEPVVEEPPPAETYEQQYKVLRGKYDKEVPRLQRAVNALEAELASLKAAPAAQVETPVATPVSPKTLITPEEVEEYGPDLLNLIGRKAQEIAAEQNTTLQSEITELKSQISGVSRDVNESARDKMLAQLDTRVEDWRDMNVDEAFLDWLDQVDSYAGRPRAKMLTEAYESNDVGRVAAFFEGFKSEHAAVASPPPADPAIPGGKPAVDLNDLVAPGKTTAVKTPASAQSEKRIWTRAQISEFYRDVQRGQYKGRDDVKRAIELDIINAGPEARIQ